LSSYFIEKKCPSRNIQVQQIICIHENKAAFRNRKAKYLTNSTQIERKRGDINSHGGKTFTSCLSTSLELKNEWENKEKKCFIAKTAKHSFAFINS
jgi:hypothetical protein